MVVNKTAQYLYICYKDQESQLMDLAVTFSIVNILTLLGLVVCVDRELACSVCRAVVEEVNYTIGKIDPKKTIQVGSFRVDSKGNQGTYEKPWARSEVHLIEVFEGVCERFKDYAQSVQNGRKNVVRTSSRSGKAMSLSGITISADVQKTLKFSCEQLVEDFEEEMISVFSKDITDIPELERQICQKATGRCSADELRNPMPKSEVEEMDKLIDSVDDDNKDEDKDEKEEL